MSSSGLSQVPWSYQKQRMSSKLLTAADCSQRSHRTPCAARRKELLARGGKSKDCIARDRNTHHVISPSKRVGTPYMPKFPTTYDHDVSTSKRESRTSGTQHGLGKLDDEGVPRVL